MLSRHSRWLQLPIAGRSHCCRCHSHQADSASQAQAQAQQAQKAAAKTSGAKLPQLVRGMRDRIGNEAELLRHIGRIASDTARSRLYEEISTPILEHTSLFQRALGDDSDVVSKELYSFSMADVSQGADRELVCLRPEGTAGVVRAIGTNNLLGSLPLRFFYQGPMFRHERPQKGRYRQFEQFGVEMVGSPHPFADVETIELADSFLCKLNLAHGLELKINSLGDPTGRKRYREVLYQHLDRHRSSMSKESIQRMDRGSVLRVMDSKDPRDQEVIRTAPSIYDYFSAEAKQHFDAVCKGLDRIRIGYSVDPSLVRGLDYYTSTVFEFVHKESANVKQGANALGPSQATVLAGGRYDNLIQSQLGTFDAVPAIGWAAGLDRLLLLMKENNLVSSPRPIVVVRVGSAPTSPESATLSSTASPSASSSSSSSSSSPSSSSPSVSSLSSSSSKLHPEKCSLDSMEASGSEHASAQHGGMDATDASSLVALDVVTQLRRAGLPAVSRWGDRASLPNQMRKAVKIGAHYVVIIGDEEYKLGGVTVKDLDTQTQEFVALDRLTEHLKSKYF